MQLKKSNTRVLASHAIWRGELTGLMSSSELAVALKSSTFNLFPKHVPVPAGSLRPIERRDQPTAVVTAKYPLVWPLTAYGNCRRTRLRPSPAGLTPRVALTGAAVYQLSCKWSGVKAAQARSESLQLLTQQLHSVCFSSIYRILTMLLHLFPPAVASIFSAVLMSQ